VATISCSVEVGQARAEKALPGVSTDVARFLAVKVVEFSGDGWGVEVRDSSGTWHDITGVQTATGYAEFGLPEGLTLDRIAIISYGSGSLARFDWLGLLRKPRLLLKAGSLRVVRRINACSEFEVECLEPWAADASVFNDVKIIIGGRKVLCGLILARELQKMGRAVTRVRLRGADYAWHLASREAGKRKYSGQVHEVIKELVKPLVEEGLLTTENVEQSSKSIDLDLSDESISILEALNRACSSEHAGFDFYVDCGADLHAFPRGAREFKGKLQIARYSATEATSEITNHAVIYGAAEKTIPADMAFEDDLSLWEAVCNASIAQDAGVYFVSSPSLRITQEAVGEVVVRLNLPEVLDLNPDPMTTKRKCLRFFVKAGPDASLKLRMISQNGAYFECGDVLGSVPPDHWGFLGYGRTWPVGVECGPKLGIWAEVQNRDGEPPDWSRIVAVEFVASLSEGQSLWLDQVHFANFRWKGEAVDEESVRRYGRHKIVVVDDDIHSDEEAQSRANEVVARKAWPDMRFDEVEVLGAEELQPGQIVRLTTMPVPEGCVLFLPLEEGSGDVAYDYSGHGNDGEIHGAKWVSTPYGRGLEFDGVDDYVEVPDSDSLHLAGELTLEFLVKFKSMPSLQILATKSYNYEFDAGMRWNGRLTFTHGDGSWETIADSADTSITAGNWYHIVYVRCITPKEIRYYVNGRFISASSYTKDVVASTNPVQIGYRAFESRYPVDGTIALVRIYNRALTPEEVRLLYEQAKRRWLTGRYIVSEITHELRGPGPIVSRLRCSKTGEEASGWPELFGRGRSRVNVIREVRDEEKPPPAQRSRPNYVVVGSKTLEDYFTDANKLKLSELERYPFKAEDIAQGAIDFAHLSEELGVAVGGFYEAEDYDGTTGADVTDDTASGGKARKASSTDPGGSLVEVV
ncbi:MAG: hypothetical protein DRJ51_08260, partial [Thermoprotei archaeon]